MRVTGPWDVSPSTARVGDETALQIIDRENGPDGRTVCIIPGNLMRRTTDGNFTRLLDEQDLANAASIRLLPQLTETLSELVKWAAHMGGWDAACWRSAEELLQQLRSANSER